MSWGCSASLFVLLMWSPRTHYEWYKETWSDVFRWIGDLAEMWSDILEDWSRTPEGLCRRCGSAFAYACG